MSNTCIARFGTIPQKAPTPFPRKDMHRFGFFKSFTTLAPRPTHPPPFHLIITTSLSPLSKSSLRPTDAPQRSDEWFALRRDKLTTSTFSTALGFWKGNRRYELWHEKVFSSESVFLDAAKRAMEWGVSNESNAIDRYRSITGRHVAMLGFATHSEERLGWVGASPDGLLECSEENGILEVKCPYNKGKPERGLPWTNMPFYYMPTNYIARLSPSLSLNLPKFVECERERER